MPRAHRIAGVSDTPRYKPKELDDCRLALRRPLILLSNLYICRRNRLDRKIRHVFFYLVISRGRHQVSSKSLRVKTKHNKNSRLPLDPDTLTYLGSLRRLVMGKQERE
jgi:hypothetical protein